MDSQQINMRQALGFTREPFDKNVPAKKLYISQQMKQLFLKLSQLLHRRGIALITGEVGAGKSTAIRAFTEQLEKNLFDIAYIADPTIGMRGILNSMAIQLNLEGGYFKWQLLDKLKYAIEKNSYDFKKTTILIIDEAQHMTTRTLEELRLFTNFKIDSQSPLNLILIGQPDVHKTIRLHSMLALSQRTNFRYHLSGLDKSEVKSYVAHHLELAGRTDQLFTDDVILEIFQHAKGIPRIINNLCYDCLLEICLLNKNIVDIPTLEKILIQCDNIQNI
ncbi:MAG: AAA family ATPase [Candidatus Omnitrophica bacterium]|nr:AAA family ATPase [Candidatus Omnitrophota bacterium]